MKKLTKIALCVVFVLVFANAAYAVNLITNGNLDAGSVGWDLYNAVWVSDDGSPNNGCIETNPVEGMGSGGFMNSLPQGTYFAVSAGTYILSWSAKSMSQVGYDRQVVWYETTDGIDLGTYPNAHNEDNCTTEWADYSMQAVVTGDRTMMVGVSGPGVNPEGSMVRYDSLSFELIPEPSLALIGLALLALRRKK